MNASTTEMMREGQQVAYPGAYIFVAVTVDQGNLGFVVWVLENSPDKLIHRSDTYAHELGDEHSPMPGSIQWQGRPRREG